MTESEGRPRNEATGSPGGDTGYGPGAAGRADELGALLAGVARGDQGAYEAVYDQTAGQVLGTVLAVVRDPAQSEEVAQEVLLDVWRSCCSTSGVLRRGSTRTWAAPRPG